MKRELKPKEAAYGTLDDGSTPDRTDKCVTSIKPTLNEIMLENHNFEVDFDTGVGVCSKCNLEIIAPKTWWDVNTPKITG